MKEDKVPLEVVVQQKEGMFIASAPLFPSCKGTGETEKVALALLGKAITKAVSKQLQVTLGKLFNNEAMHQVIVDTNQTNGAKHYVYDLQNETNLLTLFLKFKALPEYSHLIPDVMKEATRFLLAPMSNQTKAAINASVNLFEETVSNQIEETIILGYPLCLN
jgi:predicted RNase H-like HicB family nuclease